MRNITKKITNLEKLMRDAAIARAEKAEAERDLLASRMAAELYERFGGTKDECYPDYYLKWAAKVVASRVEEV